MIVGIKYTHDAGIAIINDDGELVGASELEKVNNNPRYTKLNSLSDIILLFKLLANKDDKLSDSTLCVDGWTGKNKNTKSYNGSIENWNNFLVAGYQTFRQKNIIHKGIKETFFKDYESYSHLMGHIYGSYMTSPFSSNCEDCFVLVSDGGILPTIFHVDPMNEAKVVRVKQISKMSASIYGVMGLYFGPFKDEKIKNGENNHSKDNVLLAGYDVPGKLMSYIGLGIQSMTLVEEIREINFQLDKEYDQEFFRGNYEHLLMQKICKIKDIYLYSDADILHSIHSFLEEFYIEEINKVVPPNANFIFTGGAALNIKWNSAIRSRSVVGKMYVPPFPNDSGSAIGAACCSYAAKTGYMHLTKWNVYCGMNVLENSDQFEEFRTSMSPFDLGKFVAESGDPILVLHGKSEIGPRSLGHRSIFMDPRNTKAKDIINEIKGRESFRPVAPICLEDDAPTLFYPGTPDKFMIFEHLASPFTRKEFPSIVHIDGTSRLQTVNEADCNTTYEVLKGYKSISGFGIICNTSANFNGTGFLNDMRSAISYANENGIQFIWCNGFILNLDKVNN